MTNRTQEEKDMWEESKPKINITKIARIILSNTLIWLYAVFTATTVCWWYQIGIISGWDVMWQQFIIVTKTYYGITMASPVVALVIYGILQWKDKKW